MPLVAMDLWRVDLVFVQSSGLMGQSPVALYDLWRVDGGKLVEHWTS